MRRFFVKNLLFVIAVNLLVKPLWVFMIDRTVQNSVGHEAYGTYQALLNICLIFQILLDFGLTSYNTNVISRNPDRLRTIYPSMLTTRLALTGVFSLLVLILGVSFHYKGWELILLAGIMLIQVMNSLVLYLRSNISALLRFKIDGVLSVTDRLLMILICGFLLYYSATASQFKIEWFVITQVFCYALTAIVAMIVIYKIAHERPRLSFKTRELFDAVKKSFPYAIMVFLMSIHMRSDTVLLERFISKDQAGIYASATRLLDLGNMFGLMFAGVLLPLFGNMLGNKQSVQPIIKLSVNMLLPFAFTISCVSLLWGQDIMQLLYKNAGEYDGRVFAIVMAAFPAYCIAYTYSTLLTANHNIALMNKISVTGVIISLSLNFYMLPRYGALGAAITACVTQGILALCYIYFCHREIKLPKNLKWMAAHTSFVVVIASTGYLLHNTSMVWILQIGILGTIAIVAMLAFRFLSLQVIQMLTSKQSAQ
jgi:O-antigen/teichoic acid export membrane protein